MQYSENQIENIVFQALAHPVRRTILKIVASSVKGISYTELITELGLSTGKLNYHLEQLQGLIEKNNERLYGLTPFGKKALSQLNLIKEEMTPDDEEYIRIAESAQKSSLQPTIKSFLLVGIVFSSVIIFIWSYIAYIAISEGAPIIVYVLLPILIAIGLGLLTSLILAYKRAPNWIRRFELRFSGPPT
jgi:predicted transcriptional regulator